MKKPRRFFGPSDSSGECPTVANYHVVTRVLDRQFVLEAEEKDSRKFARIRAGGKDFPAKKPLAGCVVGGWPYWYCYSSRLKNLDG